MKDKEKRARWLKRQRKAAARRAAGQTAATTATVEPGAAQEREPRRGRTQPGASGAADARERTGAANTGTVGAGCGAHGAGAGGRTGAVEAKRQEANSVTPAEMVAMANGIGEALAKGVRLDSLDPVLAKLDTALAGMSDAASPGCFTSCPPTPRVRRGNRAAATAGLGSRRCRNVTVRKRRSEQPMRPSPARHRPRLARAVRNRPAIRRARDRGGGVGPFRGQCRAGGMTRAESLTRQRRRHNRSQGRPAGPVPRRR